MRAGLMDTESAARELAVAEADLHELVGRIRDVAALEDDEGAEGAAADRRAEAS